MSSGPTLPIMLDGDPADMLNNASYVLDFLIEAMANQRPDSWTLSDDALTGQCLILDLCRTSIQAANNRISEQQQSIPT